VLGMGCVGHVSGPTCGHSVIMFCGAKFGMGRGVSLVGMGGGAQCLSFSPRRSL
jgi:hypothetical protein